MTGEEESSALEIGLHALRTFRVDTRKKRLLPVAPGVALFSRFRQDPDVWRDGICAAQCARGARHAAPADHCSCGIYGATNLKSLVEQYPGLAQGLVAVIAVEGQAIVGSEGLRAEAARVVAYWCHPSRQMNDVRAVLAEQCPTAQPFEDCDSMLAAYGLRATPDHNNQSDSGEDGQDSPQQHRVLSGGLAAALSAFWLFTQLMRFVVVPGYIGVALAGLALGASRLTKPEVLALRGDDHALWTLFVSVRVSMEALVRSGVAVHFFLVLACLLVVVRALLFRPSFRIPLWKVEIVARDTGGALLAGGSFLLAYTLQSGLPATPAIIAAPFVGLALRAAPWACCLVLFLIGRRRDSRP